GRQLGLILIDADAATSILYWNGSVSDLQWIRGQLNFLPYEISERRGINNTLIIGSGGGSDVMFPLAGGSKKVTAVELNPSVVSAVKKFGNLTGNIYDREDVDLFIDDGKRFFSSSPSQFDII